MPGVLSVEERVKIAARYEVFNLLWLFKGVGDENMVKIK